MKSSTPEVRLWVGIIEQAMKDLEDKQPRVVQDAKKFLFDRDDKRLDCIVEVLGLDPDTFKDFISIELEEYVD